VGVPSAIKLSAPTAPRLSGSPAFCPAMPMGSNGLDLVRPTYANAADREFRGDWTKHTLHGAQLALTSLYDRS
jgi:hypothetical protein